MAEEHDPYRKLRPQPPTPEEDLCSCADSPPIVLQAHLSPNPLSCLVCNLEVAPERVGFPETLAEEFASWQSFHNCFYLLWLDSGEFESWAQAQLEDPGSRVNKWGLELVTELRAFHPAYYWWFQDNGAEDFEPLSRCPACQSALTERRGRHVCEQCSIVVAN
jgi:hypothetical protein